MSAPPTPRHKRNIFAPSLKAPEWSAWGRVSSMELWEAVALSCDVEPRCVVGWIEPRPIANEPLDKFLSKLRQAMAALQINDGKLPCQPSATLPQKARVDIGDFRAWAISEGWSLPEQFPLAIAKHPQVESPQERGRRIVSLVDCEIAKGASKARAFKIVAQSVLSLKPKHKGETVSWETVKKIYEYQKALQCSPPTTPTKHHNPHW